MLKIKMDKRRSASDKATGNSAADMPKKLGTKPMDRKPARALKNQPSNAQQMRNISRVAKSGAGLVRGTINTKPAAAIDLKSLGKSDLKMIGLFASGRSLNTVGATKAD